MSAVIYKSKLLVTQKKVYLELPESMYCHLNYKDGDEMIVMSSDGKRWSEFKRAERRDDK